MAFDPSTAKLIDIPESSGFDPKTAKLITDHPETKQRQWGEIPRESLSNVLPSSARLVKETAEAVLHPIDTAQNVLDLSNAAMQSVLPDSVRELMYKINPDAAKNPEKLTAAIDYYKHRFGNEEGLKEALATDPAGIVADLFTILQPARAVTKSNVLTKLSNFDPTVAPAIAASKLNKPAEWALPAIVGVATGAGEAPIRKAFEYGREGGVNQDKLLAAARGESELSDPVDKMRAALKNMRSDASNKYNLDMEGVRALTDPVDLMPISDAINRVTGMGVYQGFDIDPKLNKIRGDIAETLNRYKQAQVPTPLQRMQGTANRPELNTVYGLDKLKQSIQGLGNWEEPRSPATRMAGGVSQAIKDEIALQSPEYADIMSRYGISAEKANDIEKTLSLGKKAKEETAIGKAQGLSRNNVNTSYGHRLKLAEELQKYSDEDFLPEIYGQALSSKIPRGLGGVTAGGIMGAGVMSMNPLAIPAMALSSPKLMGEAAVKAGQATRYGKKGLADIKDALEAGDIDPKLLANWATQEQQSQNKD